MTTDIKNKVIGIGVPTLIGLIIGAIGIYATYSDSLHNFDTRILKLEQNANKGERFTIQDGAEIDKRTTILEEKIQTLEKTKANKEDIKIINFKLDTLNTIMLEIRKDIKELTK